jgi:hypothetical protein
MRKALLGCLVVVALALAPGKPAVAADNTGRVIAGLAVLAIAGAIIANRAKADDRTLDRSKMVRRHGRRPYVAPPAYAPFGQFGQFGREYRQARSYRGLPDYCRLPKAPVLYGGGCLRAAGIRLETLPRRCAVRLLGGHGRRVAFDARCLRHVRGW